MKKMFLKHLVEGVKNFEATLFSSQKVTGLQNTRKSNLRSVTVKLSSTMRYDTPNSKRTALVTTIYVHRVGEWFTS